MDAKNCHQCKNFHSEDYCEAAIKSIAVHSTPSRTFGTFLLEGNVQLQGIYSRRLSELFMSKGEGDVARDEACLVSHKAPA